MPALNTGTRLGPYEILDAIGAGGMGEVYRGRDTRLGRIVAIKVLTSSLASDAQSRDRFEREAKTISSLNHPNICVLYDVGHERPAGSDEPPVDFLVMEYLEGETLTARLARGASRSSRSATPVSATALPPMTVDEALGVAIHIASALDCAHRQGIVHRDLKPGNVMLTKGGVKLLDFGLARLTRAGAGSDGKDGLGHGMVSLADLSMPTMTSPLTMKGAILGTLQYMAPEQLEGKVVDARADIFAFGGVLYEMLTGRRPFEGKSQASLIGAILDDQPPPVTTFQPVSPPMLDEIVARCLAKDPDDRWQTSRDLKHQLEWVAKQPESGGAIGAGTNADALAARPSAAARAVRVGGAILAGAAIAGGVVAWVLWPKPPVKPVVARFALELPDGQAFTRGGRHLLTLSPDGERLVYVANQQLYLREMRDLAITPISGTERSDSAEPIFSPDGQWVAFWSNGELKKVPVTGGTPVTIGAAQTPLGASWVGDRILLGQNTPRGIVEIPASGGDPKLLVSVDEAKGELAHGPQLLAGGRAVLFTLRTGAAAWHDSAIIIQELATGKRQVLVNGGTDARVLPTGHLVYSREGTLFAMPFDATQMVVTGTAVPVQEGIQQSAGGGQSGAAQVAWSDQGGFVFVPGSAESTVRALVWIDRKGREEFASAPQRPYALEGSALRVSPDGLQVALAVLPDAQSRATGMANPARTGTESDIWVWHIARGSLTRLTSSARAFTPIWTPDGQRICYDDSREAFCQAADGRSQPESLFKAEGLYGLRGFVPDGSRLLFTTRVKNNIDTLMATVGPPLEIRPLIKSPFSEASAAISPDGRWVAYESNETGRDEVYVRPFPAVDQGRWPISADGGNEPRWARNGRELFFTTGGAALGPATILAASVQPGASFVAGKPAVVLKLPVSSSFAYDVAPDGRFLLHRDASALGNEETKPTIVMVENWFDELKARVPVPKQ